MSRVLPSPKTIIPPHYTLCHSIIFLQITFYKSPHSKRHVKLCQFALLLLKPSCQQPCPHRGHSWIPGGSHCNCLGSSPNRQHTAIILVLLSGNLNKASCSLSCLQLLTHRAPPALKNRKYFRSLDTVSGGHHDLGRQEDSVPKNPLPHTTRSAHPWKMTAWKHSQIWALETAVMRFSLQSRYVPWLRGQSSDYQRQSAFLQGWHTADKTVSKNKV